MFKDLIWHNSIFTPPQSEKIYQSLPKALLEIASRFPESPAVILDNKIYTFSDLASRVAGLSDEINQLGNYTGPIALLQQVGLDSIAAWFACSLSGRPFLLLEPDNPPNRLVELMKLAGCRMALVDHSTSHILVDSKEIVQLISDGRYGTFIQDNGLLVDDPAMIFPTSGSTGNPKLITYATSTIQAKVQSSIQLMGIPEGVRVLIAGSHSNYGFLHHALVFLLSRNAVCLADVKTSGFDSILYAIIEHAVRHVRFTPSLFRKLAVLPKAQKALRLLDAVRFSGEPLLENDLKLAEAVLHPNCQIQNVYGSTESSLFLWKKNDDEFNYETPNVPIGKIYPLSSYAIRKLEEDDSITNKGELLIRSKFQALGDFKEGIIEKERFPLLEESSEERIYATGDIVHQLENGDLIHLGRLGRMVKIRGHRVYLTEVEQKLRSIPGVTEAVVVDYIEQDSVVIYGFVTTESYDITSEDIRRKLSSKLPDFMIPKRIEALSQIPLLAGGKVDFQALNALISTSDSIGQFRKEKNKTLLLIQIWDSLLWKGAHNYDSDFFSLGGDSLGFMILLEELEQNFRKNLSSEELRTQCTLKNLAVILGIDIPISHPIIKYKSLKASLVWPSSGRSKGIALAMPGYGGSSIAYPFHQVGFFQDYDIWVVEFPIEKGNMLQENRWWFAAREIIQGIQEGIIPAPHVIFGFSFGGGLAWLVGRLLKGSLFKPQFIIMVDAPPLHRLQRLQNESLEEALKNGSDVGMPPVLHICRSTLEKSDVLNKNREEWSQSDGILKVVELPTTEHLDMINCEVLKLAKDVAVAFLNNKDVNFQWTPVITLPNLLGCHIFCALNGNAISLQKVMNQFLIGTEINIESQSLIRLVVMTYTNNDKEKSNELIQFALEKFSDHGIIHFLNRRMKRNTTMLFSEDLPEIYPLHIVSLENKLAVLMKNTVHPEPVLIRHFYLAFDAFSAMFISRFIKYKKLVLSYI